jgi:hypothetical protein
MHKKLSPKQQKKNALTNIAVLCVLFALALVVFYFIMADSIWGFIFHPFHFTF